MSETVIWQGFGQPGGGSEWNNDVTQSGVGRRMLSRGGSSRLLKLRGHSVGTTESGRRCQLWVDAVGGFLMCFADRVVLGQAVPDSPADVAIMADLSRQHATIIRQGEDHLLEAHGKVRVEGRRISEPTLLRDGDEIELGSGVWLRFRRPHPLSSTARLDLISHHRLEPSTDAVLLMSGLCILGPRDCNHIVCRDWEHEFVLFQSGRGKLFCRSETEFEINGQLTSGSGPLPDGSRVSGADFALSVEAM
ncbi:MAG: FHA domain-containing protein [Pirellulaceae bacterium]|nr:FHA domain-containing protein [Planctomycetales bacterium]